MSRGFDRFLIHTRIAGHRKVRRLKTLKESRWCYVTGILGLAAESPERGVLLISESVPATVQDIADHADVPIKVARATVSAALEIGLLYEENGVWTVHDWDDWNPAPKTSDTREAQRERKRKSRASHTPQSRVRHTDVTRDPRAKRVSPSTSSSLKEENGLENRWGYLREFEDFAADHQAVTGSPPPKIGTKARQARLAEFTARREEGWTLDDLKAATIGAFTDEYRRRNGHYGIESVLRPTKVDELVAKGRRGASNAVSPRERARQEQKARLQAVIDGEAAA